MSGPHERPPPSGAAEASPGYHQLSPAEQADLTRYVPANAARTTAHAENEHVIRVHIHARSGILIQNYLYHVGDHGAAFLIAVIGNQIAESARA